MKQKVQNAVLHPASMAIIGLFTGFLVKLMDVYCYAQHFGVSLSDIFSQGGVWVVIGIAISLYSRSTKFAMVNIFLFCAGMLVTYYLTAQLTNSVYGWSFIKAYLFMYQGFSQDLMMLMGNLMQWKFRVPSVFKGALRSMTEKLSLIHIFYPSSFRPAYP